MSTAVCPTCEKEIDPARAPVARIRGGHVLTFCSTACADGKPVVRAEATPVRAEETATSKAWYDEADQAIARDVDDAWDDSGPAEVELEADVPPPAPRGYTWDETAHERAEEVAGAESPAGKRPLGKRHILMIAGVILVGGMVIAVIEAVSPSTPSPVAAETDAREQQAVELAPAPEPEAADEPAPIDRAKLAAAAVAQLRELMKSQSPRIVREAALALARTGDREAIDLLLERLSSEPSALARVGIAYALARAGEQRGRAVLRRSLDDNRRDLRMAAARALARLGDDAGRAKLRAMLKVRTHRLGAAGVLALLGDEKGLDELRDALEDGDPAARTRAAVYLGLAGQAEVRDRLHEILDDGDRVGAASALAVLGDEAAVPALTEQLAITSIRVDAALSLRRLGAEVDLEPLAVALGRSDEIGRISAAEAILILTDPEQPAELR